LEVFLNLGWAGVSLLGIVIVTGYRNVLCALRRDADEGRLRLAYFVAALVYSFTEAGFRMMDPVWIFFLLSAAKVPQPWTAREVDQPVIAETLEHAVRGQERLEAI
jgi:O-antigen ligase